MKFSIEDWRLSSGFAIEDDCCLVGLRYMDVEGCGSSIISELDSFTYL